MVITLESDTLYLTARFANLHGFQSSEFANRYLSGHSQNTIVIAEPKAHFLSYYR